MSVLQAVKNNRPQINVGGGCMYHGLKFSFTSPVKSKEQRGCLFLLKPPTPSKLALHKQSRGISAELDLLVLHLHSWTLNLFSWFPPDRTARRERSFADAPLPSSHAASRRTSNGASEQSHRRRLTDVWTSARGKWLPTTSTAGRANPATLPSRRRSICSWKLSRVLENDLVVFLFVVVCLFF